ncbi:MAG: hypothetical protein ACOYWZ_00175, partial [Bacillota bacterium]
MEAVSKKEKYSFLILSVDALASDVAYQLKLEGNEVKMYIQNNKHKDIMDGYIDKVDDWEAEKNNV